MTVRIVLGWFLISSITDWFIGYFGSNSVSHYASPESWFATNRWLRIACGASTRSDILHSFARDINFLGWVSNLRVVMFNRPFSYELSSFHWVNKPDPAVNLVGLTRVFWRREASARLLLHTSIAGNQEWILACARVRCLKLGATCDHNIRWNTRC